MRFISFLLMPGSKHAAFGVLLLVPLLFAVRANAGQATLAWDASTAPAVAGYMVYYGPASGTYSGKADAGLQTTYTVTALLDGHTYYYAVTAYDAGRAESGFSNEASATVSGPTAVAAPVGSPASSGSSGGGGGCTIGISTDVDPIFPVLLLATVWYFRARKRYRRVSSPESDFLSSKPVGRAIDTKYHDSV